MVMTAIDTLIANWLGKSLDTDGFPPEQPNQCYDVFIEYMRILSGNPTLYLTATQTGLAQDIYNQYESSPLLQSLFDKLPWNAKGERGDVAVWGEAPQTPKTHVALLEVDNGNTQRIFGQNQPYPYCTERDLTSTGLLGYLRPKTKQGEVMDLLTKEEENVLSILATGAYPGVDYSYDWAGKEASQANRDGMLQFWLAQSKANGGVALQLANKDAQIAQLQTSLNEIKAASLQASAPIALSPSQLQMFAAALITFIKQVIGVSQ